MVRELSYLEREINESHFLNFSKKYKDREFKVQWKKYESGSFY